MKIKKVMRLIHFMATAFFVGPVMGDSFQVKKSYVDPSLEIEVSTILPNGNVQLAGSDPFNLKKENDRIELIRRIRFQIDQGVSSVVLEIDPHSVQALTWIDTLRVWCDMAGASGIPYIVKLFDDRKKNWEVVNYFGKLRSDRIVVLNSSTKMAIQRDGEDQDFDNVSDVLAVLKRPVDKGAVRDVTIQAHGDFLRESEYGLIELLKELNDEGVRYRLDIVK